ncbi:MAG: hypothetical protein M0009_17170 [Deltaproteobacteria bacterium]|nr:hypothetical protein [Deltaproteobacteria bacterium]
MKTRFSATSFSVLRKTGAMALLFAILLQVPLTAHAYKVVVQNPFNFTAIVTLYYGIFGNHPLQIDPNSSETFDTTFLCAQGLDGHKKGSSANFQGTDMFGTWYDFPSFGASRCGDVNFKICKMPEGSSKEYSFCTY